MVRYFEDFVSSGRRGDNDQYKEVSIFGAKAVIVEISTVPLGVPVRGQEPIHME